MGEHKRQIESRVAKARALGIEQHRALGPHQNIFRADIAMHQGALVGARGLDQRSEAIREVGMRAPGREQATACSTIPFADAATSTISAPRPSVMLQTCCTKASPRG